MQIKNYKDLIIWQKSIDLVLLIYKITNKFPKDELYGLTSQIRKASVSVASNIAEGQSRFSSAEFKNFLSISKGSLAEVETQLIISLKLEYISEDEYNNVIFIHDEIRKMMFSLIKKISSKKT